MAIELKKGGDTHRIDLTKRTGSNINGEITIKLDWSDGKSGFLGIFKNAIDLDLGCFYEMRNGSKMLIDGLQFSHGRGGNRDQQTRQGCYTMPPYIWHYGDARTGGSGETISVNPVGVNDIKRIIVYTFIYEGVARWAETDAIVKVTVPGIETVEVKMGQQNTDKKFCAIAQLDFNGDNSITVKKLVTFHNGHKDCDHTYGWGFNYTPGSKD